MWMDKLERKFGRFAIPNLMKYIIFGNVLVYILTLWQPNALLYMALLPDAVMQGEVWRLLTFIFIAPTGNVLLTALSLYCYYWIGGALENAWGAFRFNLYYLIGVLATIIVSFIFKVPGVPTYINQTMFLALASLYPEAPIRMFYIIPMKAKWAGIVGAASLAYDFIIVGSIAPSIRWLILASLVNYMLFFLPLVWQRIKNKQRRRAYESQIARGRASKASSEYRRAGQRPAAHKEETGKIIKGVAFHRCHVCGITDVDDPNMTFRYCSQCNGNYEYCENHLHNHEHVQ
ncbi:MAG: rhomboid family intramembrane serine protease [Lachnospiraceae bacterium]|jgi:hypothetical protein|nr:rhomboid family intramembrane serine protease [Lachnospiraceae bacterium]